MARTKRPNGDGTVYRLPSGNWNAQVTQYGRRISKAFPTQREALAWKNDHSNRINIGMRILDPRVTVSAYLEQWLKDTKTSKAPSTWRHYSQLMKTYVYPAIGGIKICNLQSYHLQDFYDKLYDVHVGEWTIRKVHAALHAAFQVAVINGVITNNPASNSKPPKEPASEINLLDENQLRQFLVSAQSHPWYPLFQLACSSGMRMSEILAIKWSDIDFEKGSVLVQRQLLRPNGEGVQFSRLKTAKSRRSIPLSALTIQVLRDQHNDQMIKRQSAGLSWQNFNLTFTTRNGTPLSQRNVLRVFKRLLSISGLPDVHFHSLRHSFASILLQNGVPIHTVSKMLGHSSPAITLRIYSHTFTGMEMEAANMIDSLIMPISVQLENSDAL